MKPGSIGLRFLGAVASPADLLTASDDLFDDHELPAFEYMKKHLVSYSVLPSPETILTHSGVEVSIDLAGEPAAYYLDHLRRRRVDARLREAIEDMKPLLSPSNPDPYGALAAMSEAVNEARRVQAGARLVDHRFARDTLLAHYAEVKKTGGMLGIPLGWDYLDGMMGGAQPGDLLSVVARPGKGKTFALCYSALHAWSQGKRVMFVTMEMKAILIQQRLAALGAHIPAADLKLGKLTSFSMGKLEEHLGSIADAEIPFWLIDGDLGLTVEEVLMRVQQLQPDIVYIDGAYMLKYATDRTLRKFPRIDAVCEFLKQEIGGGCEIPVFATWQFNREAAKKKKDQPVGLEDIAHSDVIGQISNLVAGLFEEDEPDKVQVKKLTVLKGRNGEDGEFSIGWNFDTMDFGQKWPPLAGAEPEPDDEEVDG